jgi:hypothetical protein
MELLLKKNKMKTLKQFLEENKIETTNFQRAKIGNFIYEKGASKGKVKEDGFKVNLYDENFLDTIETQKIIIKVLTDM